MPATGRHLLVNDAGVMNTLDLGAVAKAACPQWKTVAAPMYAPALISALRVVYDAPLVGDVTRCCRRCAPDVTAKLAARAARLDAASK